MILRQLQKRFGQLDRATQDQIDALSNERLGQIEEALLDFYRREDLESWLQSHP